MTMLCDFCHEPYDYYLQHEVVTQTYSQRFYEVHRIAMKFLMCQECAYTKPVTAKIFARPRSLSL